MAVKFPFKGQTRIFSNFLVQYRAEFPVVFPSSVVYKICNIPGHFQLATTRYGSVLSYEHSLVNIYFPCEENVNIPCIKCIEAIGKMMVTNITASVTYTVYRMFQYYLNGEFGFSVFL